MMANSNMDCCSDRCLGAAHEGPVKLKKQLGKFLIFLAVLVVIYNFVSHFENVYTARYLLWESGWGSLFFILGGLFLFINTSALIWHAVLFFKYRPALPCDVRTLPKCTVIVPAYNEGKLVFSTLKRLVQSVYPKEKLEIIAVDDGSMDDTWHWITEAQRVLGRITAIRQPCNQGKRHALYAGLQQSTGEVIVTVDSDSLVEARTLHMLVSPFVHDQRVGAVAGNVKVLNRSKRTIPRMLDVLFFFSFDFMRAGQSVLNTVVCTPGALSAYRRKVVMQVLPRWINQTFFGRPANIGEDRAMTNLILKEGYHVRFQQDAVVYTDVPIRYRNLCRMFLRWARSNIRETYVMSSFIFRKFRKGPMLGARINLILQVLALSKAQLLFLGTVVCLFSNPATYAAQILMGIVVSASIQAGLYFWRNRSTEGLWAYLYGIFWFVGLSWIVPYALITPHKCGWLTRRMSKKGASNLPAVNRRWMGNGDKNFPIRTWTVRNSALCFKGKASI
jgi:hyaluronan synthase